MPLNSSFQTSSSSADPIQRPLDHKLSNYPFLANSQAARLSKSVQVTFVPLPIDSIFVATSFGRFTFIFINYRGTSSLGRRSTVKSVTASPSTTCASSIINKRSDVEGGCPASVVKETDSPEQGRRRIMADEGTGAQPCTRELHAIHRAYRRCTAYKLGFESRRSREGKFLLAT